MSLNWNISKMHDHKAFHENDREWQITNYLIWATMAIDMGAITEGNWEEFYARLTLWERLVDTPTEQLTTPQAVHRRIGLVCNVVTKTRLQWVKRVVMMRMDDFTVYASRAVEEVQA